MLISFSFEAKVPEWSVKIDDEYVVKFYGIISGENFDTSDGQSSEYEKFMSEFVLLKIEHVETQELKDFKFTVNYHTTTDGVDEPFKNINFVQSEDNDIVIEDEKILFDILFSCHDDSYLVSELFEDKLDLEFIPDRFKCFGLCKAAYEEDESMAEYIPEEYYESIVGVPKPEEEWKDAEDSSEEEEDDE